MAEPKQASLLGLPAELRNRVYELILFNSKRTVKVTKFKYIFHPACAASPDSPLSSNSSEAVAIDENGGEKKSEGEDDDDDDEEAEGTWKFELVNCWRSPGLLQACKRVRVEASPMYYRENTFSIAIDSRQTRMFNWFRALPPEALRLLRRVKLGFSCFTDVEAEQVLKYYIDTLNEEGCAPRECMFETEYGVYREMYDGLRTVYHSGKCVVAVGADGQMVVTVVPPPRSGGTVWAARESPSSQSGR